MPTTINVGLNKKIGLPDYGSLGASCNVSFEAGHDLLDSDLAGFHQKVKNAFNACQRAVDEELSRQQQPSAASMPSPQPSRSNGQDNGRHAGNGNGSNGNGYHGGSAQQRTNGRKATASQVRAIHAIINRAGLDLAETMSRCGVQFAEDLGIAQASQLIDNLKAQANGAGAGR